MIWPSLNWTAGRIGHVFLTAYNPADATILRARSVTGVIEDAIGGSYYLEGGLDAAFAFTVWDDDASVIGGEMLTSPTIVGGAVTTQNGITGPGTVFVIKRGDSAPDFTYQCRKADGTPRDVSGSSILFKMRKTPGVGALVVNRAASITDGPNGVVKYSWQHSGADTAIADEFNAEFEVTFPDGSVETFPTTDPDTDAVHEFITIKIPKDLD